MATIDPRSIECREVAIDGGKVTGVELTVEADAKAKYALKRVQMVRRGDSTGIFIAVLDKSNLPIQENVVLQYPATPPYKKLLPGNGNWPVEHMLVNGYKVEDDLGPLTIFVADESGKAISDKCRGMGLPNGQHVCFFLVFKARR